MKRLFLILLSVLIVAGLILSGCAETAPAPAPSPAPATTPPPEIIEMSYADQFPPMALQSKAQVAYCEEIEKRTNGRVKITFYPGASLLGMREIPEGLAVGIADLGYFAPTSVPGRYPTMLGLELPRGQTTAWIAGHMMQDFYDKFKPKEFEDIHPLYFSSTGPSVITSTKLIHTMDDFKGIKLRAVGRAQDIIKAVGGAPFGMPAPEIQDSIVKGVIDGAFQPVESCFTFKLADVCSSVLMTKPFYTTAPFIVAMNLSRWNQLPPDIQAVFTEVSSEWVNEMGLAWNQADIMGLGYAKEKDLEIIKLPPDVEAKLEQAIQPALDKYITDMVEAGFSEQELNGYIEYAKERIEYWSKKQIEAGIKSATGP